MALAESAQLVATLSLKDKFTPGMRKAQLGLKSLSASTRRTQDSLAKTAANVKRLGVVLAGAVIGGGAAALKWAGDFEAGLRTINTVALVSDKTLAGIGDGILDLSSKTGIAAADLQGSYYDLVSAGIKAADAQGILAQATTLSIGGLSTAGEAVDLLTTAINAYGLKASDARKITDGFAQAVAAGKVTVAEISQSFSRVAGIAANAGIGIDELQAAIGNMTAKGVPAAEVATDIRSAIIALQKPTSKMTKLQKILNVDFAKMAKDKGLAYTYNVIQHAADDLGIPMIQLTGRIEGTQFATYNAGRAYEGYVKNLQDVRKATDGAGVAQKQAEQRQQGFNASLARLKTTAHNAAVTLATGLLPAASRVTNVIGKLVSEHQGDIKRFGKQLGDLADKFFTTKNVESGLQAAIDFITSDDMKASIAFLAEKSRAVIDIYNGLPAPIKQALLVGFAANKVTGGLVTSVVRDLAGLALGSLRTITAGAVTVIGASVTSGGIPGATPVGGGSSLLGAAAGAVTKVTLVGAAATLIITAIAELDTTMQRNAGFSEREVQINNRLSTLWTDMAHVTNVNYRATMQREIDQLLAEREAIKAQREATAATKHGMTNADKAAYRQAWLTRQQTGVIKSKDLSVSVRTTVTVSARETAEGYRRVVAGHRYID